MSTKYGKNFTNFQNIGLQGSPTSAPVDQGMLEMSAGAFVKSTISISPISGSTVGSEAGAVESPYFHISAAGLSLGTGFLRMTNVGSSPYGTFRIRSSTYFDTDTAYQFPAKSGIFPIMGTFNVQLPVIVAGDFSRTAVSVTGIRSEDGLVVTIQGDPLKNLGAVQNPAQLIACAAGNGSISLTFASLGGTTTAYQEIPCAYVAVR